MAKLQISLDKTFNSGKVSGSAASSSGLTGPALELEQLKGGEWGGSLPQAVEAAQQLVPSIAAQVSQYFMQY